MTHLKILTATVLTLLLNSCSDAKTNKEADTPVQTEQKDDALQGFIQQKISDNLYVLKFQNYNTNVGVFIGTESVLLVDPMIGPNNHQLLLKAVKQLSSKPIKYVINTHSHMDHSGANAFYKELGATIISHENAKYSNALYDVTFNDSYSLDMGNETIMLRHSIAHTFDDVLVYFKNNNALFMGDTYMTNSFPHFYYGGGSAGHLGIIDKALAIGNSNTTIVAAHGKLLSSIKDLVTYREHSVNWINRINQLHGEGKTSEEIADDEKINQLSLVFNEGKRVAKQSLQRTIDKTISVETAPQISIPEKTLKDYAGLYQYENGQVDEIIYHDQKLIFRSEGNYIFEIVPLTATKFQLKGQFPNKYLTFDSGRQQFTFFNGDEYLAAIRK
ncbi:MAG TPA: MBL fold metallo-hydrolase [Fulvivirga sp.]|nr:MBL fold metallo-hydrolase [Fulvivirga sp.]